MIGSPWNPFFDQSIPGTVTRYDGRRVDSADIRQHGAYNLQRLPQYLRLIGETSGGEPVILERDYQLLSSGGKIQADAMAATFGGAWATSNGADILKTAFLWWYRPQATFNGGLPRVFYKSPLLKDENGDDTGRRWWFGAGIVHQDGRFGFTDGLGPPEVSRDWPHWWSLWHTDDVPVGLGGEPTLWLRFGTTYPLYGRECQTDNDIPDGSRIVSPIDLNRRFRLDDLLPAISRGEGEPPTNEDPAYLEPWYRQA